MSVAEAINDILPVTYQLDPTARGSVSSTFLGAPSEFSSYLSRFPQDYLLIYLESGRWEMKDGDVSYVMNPDDVLFLSPEYNRYQFLPFETSTQVMLISFSIIPTDDTLHAANEVPPVGKICIKQYTHSQHYPKIKLLFQEIISSHLSPSTLGSIKAGFLLNLLLCEIYECGQKSHQPVDPVSSEIVIMFEKNPQIFYNSKELSTYFYVCEKTLNNRFKKAYSKSIYEYQIDYKLELIRAYITEHPHVKLRQLALNYGFYDEFHLSKIFKKKFGISPKDYRSLSYQD